MVWYEEMIAGVYRPDSVDPPEMVGKSLGEYIRNSRLSLNLSQMELAERVGSTQNMISKFETNKTMPSLEVFLKLFNALELKLESVESVVFGNV